MIDFPAALLRFKIPLIAFLSGIALVVLYPFLTLALSRYSWYRRCRPAYLGIAGFGVAFGLLFLVWLGSYGLTPDAVALIHTILNQQSQKK